MSLASRRATAKTSRPFESYPADMNARSSATVDIVIVSPASEMGATVGNADGALSYHQSIERVHPDPTDTHT